VDDSTVVVRFVAGIDGAERRQVALEHGTGDIEEIGGTGYFVLSTKPGAAATALRELQQDSRVAGVEPNYVRASAATPTDPMYATSQASYFETMRLPLAWDLAPGGDDQVLAIVDSGVDLGHPDLVGRLLPGRDVKNGDNEPSDQFGHGTEVATVAAAAVDGDRMAGVTPQGRIMPVKVSGADGMSTDSLIAAGITWAADHGADVINISMGGPVSTGVLKAAVEYAQERDVLVVAAAGNQGHGFASYPAAFDGVVSVAAVDREGRRAGFSNYGPSVDVAAPGVDILVSSTDRRYHLKEGTSYSAPIVAGIALLLRGAFPTESAAAIADRLRDGARDAGPLGFDDYYGAGVVDAVGSLGYRRARGDGLAAAPLDSTPAQALPLAVTNGAVTTGSLSFEGDTDWFTFDVAEPRWFRFWFSLASGTTPSILSTELFNNELRQLGKPDEKRLAPGRYFLRVRARNPAEAPGGYQIDVHHGQSPGRLILYRPGQVSDTPLGSPAASIAAGDLTGDGRPDLLVSTAAGGGAATEHGLFLLSNTGSSFRPPLRIPSDAPATDGEMGLTVADLDGDGDLDGAVATAAGVELHLQGPDGLGGPAGLVPVADPAQVEAGDVDADGDVDLVTAGPGGLHMLRRDGGGYAVVNLAFAPVAEVEVDDMDADGRADIVALVCPDACTTLALFRSSGAGFGRTDTAVASSAAREQCVLAVGDTTGDRYPEAFTACDDQPIQLFTGSAAGLAADGPLTTESVPAEALETADFDDDGRHELVAGSAGSRRLRVLWPRYDEGWSATVREYTVGTQSPGVLGPKGLAFADLNGDATLDVAATTGDPGPIWLYQSNPVPSAGFQHWVRDTVPADGSSGADPTVQPTLRLARPVTDTPSEPLEATLTDGRTGRPVPATATYDVPNNSVVLHPEEPLVPGRVYSVSVRNVRDRFNALMPSADCCFRFVVGQLPATIDPPGLPSPPAPPPGGGNGDPPVGPAKKDPAPSGYWMIDRDGTGDAVAEQRRGAEAIDGAVDLEPTPTGKGYWILNRDGMVLEFGDAISLGNADLSRLAPDERPASLSATPSGKGYWVFTNRGRAIAFGDAGFLGDVSAVKLNGPVLGSVATPTGRGYYMVASDGGIFAFGDAAFAGSMGGTKLNAPVQSLVPDADGQGYWLVASDGGIFAFDAPFRGSMGGTKLNKPVAGMVRYGDGYLMVGADGGIFNFSSLPFSGSLGATPPPSPVVAVAALPA
jgi:hypothetical protein